MTKRDFVWIVILVIFALASIAVDFTNEPVWVIRDSGSAFGTRKNGDLDARWRVQAGNGVMMWGDGQSAPYAGMGFTKQADGRAMLELNSASPVGIILNSSGGDALSITAENGCLVIRNETHSADYIIQTICDAPTPTDPPTATEAVTPTAVPSVTESAIPTNTPVVSATAIPNCSVYTINPVFIQGTWGSGQPRVYISVANSGADSPSIESMSFTWDLYHTLNPGQFVTRWRFNGVVISNTDQLDSPASIPGSPSAILGAGTNRVLSLDYSDLDAAWPGIVPANSFGVEIHLSNGCSLFRAAIPTPQATPTQE
jgi:hypothetical protein